MAIRAEKWWACRPFCLTLLVTLAVLGLVLVGCGGGGDAHSHAGDGHAEDGHADDGHGDEGHAGEGHGAAGSWAVTAFGEGHEVFAEAPPLVAGEPARVLAHVTLLDGFAPLAEGRVEVVLRGDGDESFAATGPQRPGVFNVQVTPAEPGERELVFRVTGPAGSEEIRAGAVRVGTGRAGDGGEPGRLLRAPAPRGALDGGEPTEFLKEEQWSSDFGTAWVRRGGLRESARGLARLRAPAGGDVTVTAPLDAVVRPAGAGAGDGAAWPYPGMEVRSGQRLFRLLPRVSAERSLAELESRVTVLTSELETARARRQRLEDLLEVEAVSRREVEEARARQRALEANLEAARRDLASARSARSGTGSGGVGGETVVISAPIDGRVAAVSASPGASVAAGEALARVVRTDPVWVEVSLAPEAANRVGAARGSSPRSADGGGLGGLILTSGDGPPIRLPAERVRLVSVAPEADAATGRVPVLVEVTGGLGLSLGTVVDAEVLLAGDRPGVVVPTTALVDDGGVPVVYLQLAGERFVRQEVEVLLRQGEDALVEGLVPGQRLVTRGGEAIRRATLMETGGGHGHVH